MMDPCRAWAPVHSPELVQAVAPVEVHASCDGEPGGTLEGDSSTVMTGGTSTCEEGAATMAMPLAPATATVPVTAFVAVSMMAMDCALLLDAYSCVPSGV